MPTIAYPFIEVTIDTSGLTPTAQRSPGVIAVVGASNAGAAAANTPLAVDSIGQAEDLFGAGTALYESLEIALKQDPKPSKVYGVKTAGGDYAAGLASLEAADDVTFVSLANETDAAELDLLKDHVENQSADGNKRIGVAMVDPTVGKSPTYVADVMTAAMTALKSASSRMVMVAARGATVDAASAAMAAMAGYAPHISTVLKKVRDVTMPVESQFSPTEIKGLSEENIIPLIDPALIPGESIHFAEGRAYTTDADLLYIDIVRTLDDIEFRLKAGLIGQIGDARITKAGMTRVKTKIEGILGPLKRNAVIDDFSINIPVLAVLNLPKEAWTATDAAIVTTARAERTVDVFLDVTYGPAVHRLKVTLAPTF